MLGFRQILVRFGGDRFPPRCDLLTADVVANLETETALANRKWFTVSLHDVDVDSSSSAVM